MLKSRQSKGKDVTKKRMWWRRDDVGRGLRPCRSPHNTIFTTHAIWFFTTLSGWFHQVFSYEWWEKLLHHDRDNDHFHRCTAFCRSSSTVSEHSKLREFVFPWQTAMYWICGTTTSSSAPLWAAPCAQWRTRLLRQRSRLVRCFHLASFRVRFSICALRSFPHFIISC